MFMYKYKHDLWSFNLPAVTLMLLYIQPVKSSPE